MIVVGDSYYDFKLGLKGLELLSQNLDINEELDFILYCGLLKYPNITIKEIEKIISNLSSEQILQIKKSVDDADFISKEELTDLYIRCGELGISPSEFFFLTPKEIDDMYEGYLRTKELESNIVLLAINQSKGKSNELIRFIPNKEYTIGSEEDRNRTFLALGINEVK